MVKRGKGEGRWKDKKMFAREGRNGGKMRRKKKRRGICWRKKKKKKR